MTYEGAINPEIERRVAAGERGPYTAAEYYALPKDGPRFQLMRGWLVREPSPLEVHQRVLGNLYMLLRCWVDKHNAGQIYFAPFDTALSPQDIVQPDILFVTHEHRSRITPRNVQGAPDLVVEILSPSTRSRDRNVKLALFAEAGVREAWLVEPETEVVEVLPLQLNTPAFRFYRGERIASAVLGALDFDVDRIFE